MTNIITLTEYFWLIPVVVLASIALGVWARARDRERHAALADRMGKTRLSCIAAPLPGDLSMIARLGEGVAPRQSADALVMRTTVGLRLISLGLSGLFVWFMFSGVFAPQGLTPSVGIMPWLVVAGLGIGVLDILSYELRVDRYGMVLTRCVVWRRTYDWGDLLGIDDDQHYQYVLAFAKGGRVKVLKHLVGMPGFLTVVTDVLVRNDARNAGTARG